MSASTQDTATCISLDEQLWYDYKLSALVSGLIHKVLWTKRGIMVPSVLHPGAPESNLSPFNPSEKDQRETLSPVHFSPSFCVPSFTDHSSLQYVNLLRAWPKKHIYSKPCWERKSENRLSASYWSPAVLLGKRRHQEFFWAVEKPSGIVVWADAHCQSPVSLGGWLKYTTFNQYTHLPNWLVEQENQI